MKRILTYLAAATALCVSVISCRQEKHLARYVDPSIGTERGGHVVVGPCYPFGMVKPSPDVQGCNPGWGDISMPIRGFSQLHVSGTGGSPKYGNVLLMPFSTGMNQQEQYAMRTEETMELGYYATVLKDSGIRVEITSAERAVLYRFTYPEGGGRGLSVDAYFALKNRRGGGQRNLGGDVRKISNNELRGFTVAEGGWGGGGPYTVYFCVLTDTPIAHSKKLYQKMAMGFEPDKPEVLVKVGISFISEDQAKENAEKGLPDWDFEGARERLVAQWESLLARVQIDPRSSLKQKRMFYTALYHAMLMPSDRTGEWEKAQPDEPYYDDYFTLWDTYRCNLPLITLIDEKREADIVQSLINIYRYDGFMPDGRSGNCNGSTQGSSNADIVITDACLKGVEGIDYETGLEAMIKDATVSSERENKEGRVGLQWYNTIGYIPWWVSHAGSRTVDHSFCDYAISVLADRLGHKDLAEKYREQSHNWRNLFRKDVEDDGVRGFILPRDEKGNWLDEFAVDLSGDGKPDTTFVFRPDQSFRGHWNNFYYEANAYETSLCVPHDIDLLIEECGGVEAFKQRLDQLFGKGYCDMGNEPSFLTSCLYHWIGRPDLTSDLISKLLQENFDDSPRGIPGNDDSGAMSSWLVFHMSGLYPFAGTDLYLIHSPQVKRAVYTVKDGKRFTIVAKGLSPERKYIRSAKLNGKDYPYSTIRHEDIVRGGRLVLEMAETPGTWGQEMQAYK
jgi:predicted alpha-1,2-mannosidase